MEELENKKHTVLINDALFNDIKEYCSLNDLKIGEFVNEILNKALLVEKFGSTPFVDFNKEREYVKDSISKTSIEFLDTPIEEEKHVVDIDCKKSTNKLEEIDIPITIEQEEKNIIEPIKKKNKRKL